MWILAALITAGLTLWRKLRAPARPASTQPDRRPAHPPVGEVAAGSGGAPGVVAALLVAALAVSLAQTIVVAALPAFGRELGASTTAVTWVLTAFMLSSAVATPIAGRLGDMFGYRRILLACLYCFAIGTVVCGLAAGAHSLGGLVTGRALQGIGGGVFPLAFGIVRTALPPPKVPSIVALLSAMFGIGGAAGMVVAGPVVDGPGTAWLFWGTLALAAIALSFSSEIRATGTGSASSAAAGPHAGSAPRMGPVRHGRVDVAGAVLLSGTLTCLLLAVTQGRAWGWGSAPVAGLFAATALLLAGFAVTELRVADPLVDLRLLRRRALAATNLATFIVGMAMFGVITLIPRLVQTPPSAGYGFGASATEAGLVMLPVAGAMLVAGPLAARLGRRAGARVPLQAGAACAVVAFVLLAAAHTQMWYVYAAGLIVGAGYGLAFASIGNLVVESVEPRQTGVATGVNTIVRTVGGAVGAQIAAAVLAAGTPGTSGMPEEPAYTGGFLAFAVLAAVALAAASAVPRPRPGREDMTREEIGHSPSDRQRS
ncbi:MFS transporter [Nonomuraea rosea]|uniref:MFS transporter n=1 Tax=Nonomuraea rosea TaxID=638574 RepID=A0ABP6ZNN6_9ACTN